MSSTEKPIGERFQLMTTKDSASPQVTRKMFVEGLTPPGCKGDVTLAEAVNSAFVARTYRPRATRVLEDATHICCSTLGEMRNANGNPFRSPENVVEAIAAILDDVGTKAKVPQLPPTAIIETKPGNFTYYYAFTRPCPPDQFMTIMHSINEAGYVDENCADLVRLNRLPGSKPEGKEHRAELRAWNPEVKYDPDELLSKMEVAEIAYDAAARGFERIPAPPGVVVEDAMLEWLEANGWVQKDMGDGWYMITCPWKEEHTDQSRNDGARYRPCDETSIVRAFKCWHSHGHSTTDFLRHMHEHYGAPEVGVEFEIERRLDMLPRQENSLGLDAMVEQQQEEAQEERDKLDEARDKLVWYEPKGAVINLDDPNFTLCSYAGVKGAWSPHDIIEVGPRGGVRRQSIIDLWRAGEKKITRQLPHLDPRQKPGWTGEFVNTYRPFDNGGVEPDGKGAHMFFRLVAHVYPEDTEHALDWFAYKLQHPWARMVSLVNYTPTFGTGRSSVMEIFGEILGHTAHVSASRVIGAKATQFNSYLENLLICMHEVAEGSEEGMRVSRPVFERLKDINDPNRSKVVIERKGHDPVTVDCYCSCLIGTNAYDGLPLERGDRRFTLCKGNKTPLLEARPDIIRWMEAGGKEDPASLEDIRQALMRRDVSGFNPNVPLETQAKLDMIEASQSPMDLLFEEIMEATGVTTAGILAGTAYSMSKIARQYGEGRVERMAMAYLRRHSDKLGKIKWRGAAVNAWRGHIYNTEVSPQEWLEHADWNQTNAAQRKPLSHVRVVK